MKRKSFALWLAALCPLFLLIAMMTYGAWREYVAWSGVKPLIVAELKLVHSGSPVRLQVHAIAPERDRELRNASEDIEAMAHVLLGRAHNQQLSFEPSAPQDWQRMAPAAKQLLADAEPMFLKLESLLQHNDDGRYLISNAVVDLLEASFHYSCYSEDDDEALRALTLLSKLAASGYDSRDSVASLQLDQLRRSYGLYQLLAESLGQVDWTQSQLDQLSTTILQSLDISRRLKASRDLSTQATFQSILSAYDWQVTGADVADDIRWSMKVDSVYLRSALEAARDKEDAVIKDVNDLEKSKDIVGRNQYQRMRLPRGGALAPTVPSNQRNWGIVWDQTPYLAFILGHVEDTRRALAIAVAIKQFELAQDRWPSLRELKPLENGLPLAMTTVDGRPFKYKVPVAADAETVTLINTSEFVGNELNSFVPDDRQIKAIHIRRH